MDNSILELHNKQLKEINQSHRLHYSDIVRLSKFLCTDNTIFDQEKCCLWKGYLTVNKKNKNISYINFFFNRKKVILHRLLYINYVDTLKDDEYLKFTCKNKGCCNINHMKKYLYKNRVHKVNKILDDKSENPDDLTIFF